MMEHAAINIRSLIQSDRKRRAGKFHLIFDGVWGFKIRKPQCFFRIQSQRKARQLLKKARLCLKQHNYLMLVAGVFCWMSSLVLAEPSVIEPAEDSIDDMRRTDVLTSGGQIVAGIFRGDPKAKFDRTQIHVCLPADVHNTWQLWLKLETADGVLLARYRYPRDRLRPGEIVRLSAPGRRTTDEEFAQYPLGATGIRAILGPREHDNKIWLVAQLAEKVDGLRAALLTTTDTPTSRTINGNGERQQCTDVHTLSGFNHATTVFWTACEFTTGRGPNTLRLTRHTNPSIFDDLNLVACGE